jgi:hypothetical protein
MGIDRKMPAQHKSSDDRAQAPTRQVLEEASDAIDEAIETVKEKLRERD